VPDPAVAPHMVMIAMANMWLVRGQQPLAAHGTETGCRVDDRLMTTLTILNELISTQDTKGLILRHGREVAARGTQLVSVSHNLRRIMVFMRNKEFAL
jgi:hypothetical protein